MGGFFICRPLLRPITMRGITKRQSDMLGKKCVKKVGECCSIGAYFFCIREYLHVSCLLWFQTHYCRVETLTLAAIKRI